MNQRFDKLSEDIKEIDEGNPQVFEKLFQHCTACVQNMKLEGKISQERLLEFYSFFKQANTGNAEEQYAPSMLDLKGKAKFAAWKSKFE